MTNQTERYDLHTHLFTTWDKGRFSLERGSRESDAILDAIRDKGLDGIVLANFADYRYEKFVRDMRRWGDMKYIPVKNLGNALVVVDKEETKEIKIIRGEEVPTPQGHVLVIGMDYGCNIGQGRTLTEVCKIARSSGASIVSAHTFYSQGVREELVRNPHLFHSWESKNCNHKPLSDEIIMDIGISICKKGIHVSDSHNRKDLGNAYIEVDGGFDFLSSDEMRDSMRDVLVTGKFNPVMVRMNPLASRLFHIPLAMYDGCFRMKVGLLKSEPPYSIRFLNQDFFAKYGKPPEIFRKTE